MYGNPETTPGGRALKFYASVRIDIRRGEQLKDGTTVVGNRTKAKIVKNKVAPPFRTAEFDILYGEGISKEGSLLDNAVALDIIHKSGAWFSYGDQRIGQGRENTRKFLKENPETAAEIDKLVRAELRHGEQQAVFVRVADAARRHQTEDLAGRAGVENAQQRRHSAGNLHVLLGTEMRILPVQQLVAQGNKFSRKVHKQPRFFTDRRDNRRFPS